MRKKLAILLISLHLLGNTEAGQVFKVPQLLEHYSQHKKENQSLGFIDFFVMHYGGDDTYGKPGLTVHIYPALFLTFLYLLLYNHRGRDNFQFFFHPTIFVRTGYERHSIAD